MADLGLDFGKNLTPHLVVCEDPDELRSHLDALNENGVGPVVVGWCAPPYPYPFLVTYIDHGDDVYPEVFTDSPWQMGVDWNRPPRGDECNAHDTDPDGLEGLRYPVTIIGPSSSRLRCEYEVETDENGPSTPTAEEATRDA